MIIGDIHPHDAQAETIPHCPSASPLVSHLPKMMATLIAARAALDFSLIFEILFIVATSVP